MYKKSSVLICFFILSFSLFAANPLWKTISTPQLEAGFKQDIVPQQFLTLQLDLPALKNVLQNAPVEFTWQAKEHPLVIELPMPDGSYQQFAVVSSSIMEDGLAVRFPQIKTYSAQGITNRAATAKLDVTDWGFHAQVLSPDGVWYIDPFSKQNTADYLCYFKKDYYNAEKAKFSDEVIIDDDYTPAIGTAKSGSCIGGTLRKYRLAVACTGEYAQAIGGASVTVSQTLSAITTTVNRVDGVYETEMAIRMILIGTETNVIFTNPSTDPFSGNNNANTLIGQSQTVINANITSANYDMGHTFSTGGGGLSSLGCICKTNSKAKSITGSSSPTGDSYDIDYVAHEMGHAFGANHTFNSSQGSCSGNVNTGTRYEPGSGTTIMAYAGICGSDDIQPHSDPYFHTASFDEIVAYTNSGTGNTCPVATATGNNSPVVTMPASGKTIPANTPFFLTGSATDVDGDALTFDWEEMDKGALTAWNSGATSTTAPCFKSIVPTVSPTRYFPSLAYINAGFPANPTNLMGGLFGETMSSVSRTMNFRLTVRDNKTGGGGVATGGNGCSSTAAFTVSTTSTAGPFKETFPNGGEAWNGGTPQTVTWNVANTTASPVSCANVDIVMSVDGGLTYPFVVAANIPNNGSVSIITPNIVTNITVRFMIRCADNYFFDVSDNNFSIINDSNLPLWTGPTGVNEVKVADIKLEVYPNPVGEKLMVNGYQLLGNSIHIYDALGRECIALFPLVKGVRGIELNVSQLSSGLYFIKATDAKGNIKTAKFVKE